MDSTKKADFEIPPPSIPPKDIRETHTADVVVVGGVPSGVADAIAAGYLGRWLWLLSLCKLVQCPLLSPRWMTICWPISSVRHGSLAGFLPS